MDEQLKSVVERKYPNVDTENQGVNQKFNIEGYNVVIFYTQRGSSRERYVIVSMADKDTGITEFLEPIKMVDVSNLEDFSSDSEIDVEDVMHAQEAIDTYLWKKRQQDISKRNLAVIALAA